MTTIAIAAIIANEYKLVTMSDGDFNVVGQTLKNYYNTPELINALLERGNIVTLGNTIEESTFTGEPVTILPTIDIQESQITISEKNFFHLNSEWFIRDYGSDHYRLV